MIYGNPPFHGIAGGAMIKMQVIGSGQHVIDFPERVTSKITDPQEGRVINTQQISIPYSARHTMRSCLSYRKEDRLAIPELLAHNFLKSGQDSGERFCCLKIMAFLTLLDSQFRSSAMTRY
jgi:hypothetical protein